MYIVVLCSNKHFLKVWSRGAMHKPIKKTNNNLQKGAPIFKLTDHLYLYNFQY